MAFVIREATTADVPSLARLHVATFIGTHGGDHPPTIALRERQWSEAFAEAIINWFCYVIEGADGTLVGFAKGMPYAHREQLDFAGELNKIYLLHKFHRRGLGRRLVGTVARRFLQQGITSMLLFGDAWNPSNGFYEALGAEKLVSAGGEFHGGYGWRDLTRLAAVCPVR